MNCVHTNRAIRVICSIHDPCYSPFKLFTGFTKVALMV